MKSIDTTYNVNLLQKPSKKRIKSKVVTIKSIN